MTMKRYAGRVVFLTGAAQGIGAATARRLFAEGATVVLADRNTDGAAHVADELGDPDRTLVVSCDLTDRASVDGAVAAAVERFGRLDALVNVAGGALRHPALLEGMDDDGWNRTLDLNLSGPMRCIRAVAPHLGRGGAIVLVSSVNGLQAWGGESYSSAKAGLVVLAKNLAVELGPAGVRINVVAPGPCGHPCGMTRAGPTGSPRCTRWAGWGSRRTSPRRSPSSPRTTPRGSPASRCRSTAAGERARCTSCASCGRTEPAQSKRAKGAA